MSSYEFVLNYLFIEVNVKTMWETNDNITDYNYFCKFLIKATSRLSALIKSNKACLFNEFFSDLNILVKGSLHRIQSECPSLSKCGQMVSGIFALLRTLDMPTDASRAC